MGFVSVQLQVPFNKYFDVEALQETHRVMTMDRFMEQLASDLWPPEKRICKIYIYFLYIKVVSQVLEVKSYVYVLK